ncbi:hypothetical protein KP509_1Z115300 [Ceratopteris richardii]|nr:hypothetical protein KP509_1Z115300 [Ceratopteris richardii]
MLQKTLASHCFKGLDIDGRVCPSCGAGRVSLKLTRFGLGYFFGCDKYPDCTFTAEVGDGHTESSSAESSTSAEIKMVGKYDVLLGIDPETDLEIRVKRGPFGYYIQLGSGKGRSNFKIPKTFDPTALTLQKAKEIMTFPLTLGNHPDDGQPVTIAIGNTGYYVRHGNVSTSLSEGAEPLQFTLESALDILKGKRLSRSGRKTMVSTATGKHKNQRKQKITELSVTSEAQNGLVPEDVVVESADLEANTGKEVRAKAKMRRTNRKEIHKTERQVTDEELVHTDFKFEETQGQTQTHITIKANRRTRKTNSKMSNDEGNVEADAVCVSKDKDPVELGKQKRRNMKSKPGTGTVEKVKEGRERRSKTLTGGHLNDENCSFGEPDMDYEKERQQMNDVLSTDKKKVGRPSKRRVSLASVASE